ncbi:MAG: DUF1761 domain-containing protein [Trueperaceae bacterium]
MLDFDVNWLAVISAAVADMILGSLWYSPVLFGKQWMKAIGKKPEELGSPTNAMIVATIVSLIFAFVLAVVLVSLQVTTLVGGAGVGLLLWFGFVLTNVALGLAFEGGNRTVGGLFLSYRLVAFLLAGAILGLWL